jgi:hypothetical protein
MLRTMRRGAWLGILCVSFAAACAVGGQVLGTDSGVPDDSGGPAPDVKQKSDASGDGAVTCTAPEFLCPEAGCVNLSNDPSHCGQCNTVCAVADAGGLGLEAGSDNNPDAGLPPGDAAPPDGAPWSTGTPDCTNKTCNVTCPPNMTLCTDGVCYDTQRFHDHCGDCNTACQATEYCTLGHCCGVGTEYCGTACIDVLGDPSNCGGCNIQCPTNYACVNGACTSCSNTNSALTATATSSGGGTGAYGPAAMNDNSLESNSCSAFEWTTATSSPGTAWVAYSWTTSKKLVKMHIDTTTTSPNVCGYGRTLGGAEIQYWNGSSWVTDGTVSGETNDWDYTFTSPVTTTQVRLYAIYANSSSNQPSNPIIYEWQVTGCN